MEDKVRELMTIANIPQEVAQNLLTITNGDVNAAVSFMVEAQRFNNAPKPAATQNSKAPARSQPKGGITSFSDIRTVDPDDEKRDSYYAGGEKSGIAILDPKDISRDDLVGKVFQSAKRYGAIPKCEVPQEEEKFSGVGYTLGNTVDNSKQVAPKSAQGIKTVILTFWKDCFTVDDGPPRQLTDPANKSFLEDVNKGVVPRELEALAGGGFDVNIELINKNEVYSPPKPKIVAFSGSGQTVGVQTSAGTKAAVAKLITLDEGQPSTTIQVRLHDGGRLVIKCNHSHTVGEVRSHIEATKPTGKCMELRTTYPNKILDNDDITIKDAGLLNAAIVQRI